MDLKKMLNSILKSDINYLEIFVYFIASLIVFISIVYSIYYYVINYKKGEDTLLNIKIHMSNYISLSLSIILAIEILKIYYIKTYKQLVIVSVLVLLKLIINYFLMMEVEDAHEQLDE
jgi:uncharacterized membrane protein